MSLQSAGDSPVASNRLYSTASHLFPAIYANPGVSTPSAILEAQASSAQSGPQTDPFSDTLMPIIEGRPISAIHESEPASVVEKAGGFKWTLLPLFIIFQYFVLALHSTSHDQVFLMYLTSYVRALPKLSSISHRDVNYRAYAKGGLGLEPGHFAFLSLSRVFMRFVRLR